MDKVPSGGLMDSNSGVSTQEIGLKIGNTEEELSSSEITIDTTDTGLMECLKVKAE
jgi:hypothetical protein